MMTNGKAPNPTSTFPTGKPQPIVDPDGTRPNERAGKPEPTVEYKSLPGFHVVRADGTFLGTYNTAADAQAFIDSHVAPQDIKASIVEGKPEA